MSKNKELEDIIKLIKFRRNITQNDIAVELGYTAPYLSSVINGKYEFTEEIRNKLYETYSDCFLNNVKVYGGEDSSNVLPKGLLPLIPIDVIAGFPSDEDSFDMESCEYYNVPEFANKGAQYLIKVAGDSMFPRYSSGDILACRKIDSVTFFQWGKVYVLDTRQGALIKRVFEDKECKDNITCRSENHENYPDFTLPKSEIRSISIVVGVIRME